MTTAMSAAARPGRYRTRQVARFELAKILTLRSTAITLGLTVVACLLVTGLVSHAQTTQPFGPGFDPTQTALAGMIPAALTGGVLGALLITGEYASGTIRTTLAAAPRRPFLLGVKVGVTTVLLLVFFEALSFATFLLGQAILSGGAPGTFATFPGKGPFGGALVPRKLPTATLATPGALRAVLLTGVFVTLLALLSFGFGLVFRHTAAAIAGFAGVVFVLPLVMHGIDAGGVRYLPTSILTNSIMSTVHVGPGGPGGYPPLSAGVGLLVMAIYAAIALGAGAMVFVRRDA